MGLTLITEATADVVALADMKAHLRVEHTDHDDLIQTYIDAEVAFSEDFTGRALAPQTWDYTFDAYPVEGEPQRIDLPLARVISVDAVYYKDADGVEQTLSEDDYVVDLTSQPARIALVPNGSWPITYEAIDSGRVRFQAGYSDGNSPIGADVAEDIKLAIKLRVQADYDGGDQADKLREASLIYLRRRSVNLSLA
jgi:uncharacterized phiE125 gp8 family phage protein